MNGKHKTDETGITALKWRQDQLKASPLVEGGSIKVKFPEGPDGGTWGSSKMVCTATYVDIELGDFSAWEDAALAISVCAEENPDAITRAAPKTKRGRKSTVNGNGHDVEFSGYGEGIPSSVLANELERRGRALLSAARILRDPVDSD